MNIRLKLVTIFFILGLIPLVVLYGTYQKVRNNVEQAVMEKVAKSASLLNQLVERNLFERYQNVQAFTFSLDGENLQKLSTPEQKEKLNNYMNELVLHYQIYTNLLLMSPAGELIATNNINAKGLSLAAKDTRFMDECDSTKWFQDVLEEKFLIVSKTKSNVVVAGPSRDICSKKNNQSYSNKDNYLMVFALPVYNDSGEIVAVWANFLDFQVVENLYAEVYKILAREGAPHAELSLLDAQGKLLIDYDPLGKLSAKYRRDFVVLEQLNLAEKGVEAARMAVSGHSGANISLNYRKQIHQVSGYAYSSSEFGLPNLGWSTLVRIPTNEAFKEAEQLRNNLLIAGIILSSLLTLSAAWMSHRVSEPLRQISQMVRRLSEGETSEPLYSLSRINEVAEIIRALNLFREQLNERDVLQKKNELQAKELEIRNRAIDAATTGILVTDAQKNDNPVIYVNPAFQNLTGYAPHEAIGRSYSFLFGDISKQPELHKVYHAFKEGSTCEVVLQSHRKNRTIYWNNLRVSPVLGHDGSVTHFVGIMTDITLLKQTQDALHTANIQLEQRVLQRTFELKQAENRMRAVFETAIEGIVVADENANILDVNPGVEHIFGFEREELLGNNVAMIMAESYRSEHDSYLKAYKETGQKRIIGNIREVCGQHKGGRDIPLELSVGVSWIEDNQFFVGILRDISDKVRSREQLKGLVQRLNLATEAGGIGIWEWDVLNGKLEWDERMCHMYNIDKNNSESVLTMWQKAVHPEDIGWLEKRLEEALIEPPFEAEFRIVQPAGEIAWIKAAADVFYDDARQPLKMVGVSMDVTKEHQAQQLLKQESQQARTANEAKSRFLASMSHEIRTPMNGIIGMVDLMHETDLTSDQRSMINTVRDASFALLTIINDILDFSKIEAGQMAIESIPTSIITLIEQCSSMLWSDAHRQGVDIYLDIDPAMPAFILGDPVRYRQIVLNLLGNAVKFSKDQKYRGEVWVKVRYFEEQFVLTIKDNGIGISDKQMSHLFQPFVQADSSTTRKYGGSGLGLSISRSLVKIMGGIIKVESTVDLGSSFIVELPCCQVPLSKNKKEVIDLSSINILMVVANPQVARTIRRQISFWGGKVRRVPSPNKIGRILKRTKENKYQFDLIIIDQDSKNLELQKQLDSIYDKNTQTSIRYLSLSKSPSKKNQMAEMNHMVIDVCPLKPSDLAHGIAIVLGRESPFPPREETSSAVEPINVPSIEEAEMTKQLILVAEDQATNREVLHRQLHHLGYACEFAEDGKKAFELWLTGRFSLLLTDCHMPDMDGFELTSEIRNLESKLSYRKHTPIIAITANALSGEAEHCMASGMDDYLSKPVDLALLKATIKRWLKPQHQPIGLEKGELENLALSKESNSESYSQVSNNEKNSPINFEHLVEILGVDDKEILNSILKVYWESAQKDYQHIQQAITEQNAKLLRDTAHSAKGAANSVGALILGRSLGELEKDADGEDWNRVGQLFELISRDFEQVSEFFGQLDNDKSETPN